MPSDLGRAWDDLVRRHWKDLWGTGRSADAARNALRAFFAAVQEELNRQRRAIEDMRRGAPAREPAPPAKAPPARAAPTPLPKPSIAAAILDPKARERIERILGHRFQNPRLLEEALAHPSYTYEKPEIGLPSNYRLAFFGDALLGFLVADALHSGFPDADQQGLTEMRKRLVSRPALGRTAERLGIGPYLILGRALEVEGRK
ncbi:MAG TPA: ribonuclease III domain-containing protein, partial [Thermoplasmata archaeon]|nr:ribonuclease III domain-containing protein [Thermoplasmata archaeon]